MFILEFIMSNIYTEKVSGLSDIDADLKIKSNEKEEKISAWRKATHTLKQTKFERSTK